MNAKKAKQLRKKIYGNSDFRERQYSAIKTTGQTFVDKKRQEYQNAKRNG
jgi:hypothetical protein